MEIDKLPNVKKYWINNGYLNIELQDNHLLRMNFNNMETLKKQLTLTDVSNSEVALKAFVEEFVEAWEDGMGGDTDLYKKAKSLL